MPSTPYFVSLKFSPIIYPVSFDSMLTEIRPKHQTSIFYKTSFRFRFNSENFQSGEGARGLKVCVCWVFASLLVLEVF